MLTGASETEVMIAKKTKIDEPVADSIQKNGKNPKLFTRILQEAIGYLRGFVEYVRETQYCEKDPDGNPLLDHDMKIDVTPESLPGKCRGERPSSEMQEVEVLRLQQILNKMKKQEQKIYAIEKSVVKLEKELADVKRKWFHRKEQKELEGKIETKKVQLEKGWNVEDCKKRIERLEKKLGRESNKIVGENEQKSKKQKSSMKFQETLSVPDEIRKYKQLMDEGIITEDQFEKKKLQLLEL